ncbi:MAG: PEP-CTERM/exosortase system-associated acyltransferase [Candidatus Omnitrophota bacterium]
MGSHFIFKKIDSVELLQKVYQLRFQVYCRERQYIQESECMDGLEIDECDPHALHFAAFDAQENMVGAVRLILSSCQQFPIEKHCTHLILPVNTHRRQYAEISRLVISKLYRTQAAERPSRYIQQLGEITHGLCCLLYEECRLSGVTHCLALMEEPLNLLLRLRGYIFSAVGPAVDVYGRVTPYVFNVADNERKGMFKDHDDVSYGRREIQIQKDHFA